MRAVVPKNNASWKGHWDCAESVSWIVFQLSDKLYGCNYDLGNPANTDAYVGYWPDSTESFDKKTIDNVFGSDTLKAVEAFQQAKELVVDGKVWERYSRCFRDSTIEYQMII